VQPTEGETAMVAELLWEAASLMLICILIIAGVCCADNKQRYAALFPGKTNR
jgi:hypothetical protein